MRLCPRRLLLLALSDPRDVGVKAADAKAMIKEADTSNEGQIDFLAFANLMSRKMAEARPLRYSFIFHFQFMLPAFRLLFSSPSLFTVFFLPPPPPSSYSPLPLNLSDPTLMRP